MLKSRPDQDTDPSQEKDHGHDCLQIQGEAENVLSSIPLVGGSLPFGRRHGCPEQVSRCRQCNESSHDQHNTNHLN